MSFQKYSLILDIFLNHLIPETKKSVSCGNKIFGSFVIKKDDLSLIVTGTNNEMKNPLFHGEISTIINFFKLTNIHPKEYLFISSHEPCSLCLSAITWSGFDNFYYFFPYEDTKDKFYIPHDIQILKEIFYINNGKYNKKNSYWNSYSIIDEIKKQKNIKKYNFKKKIDRIYDEYNNLSQLYQNNKNKNNIPLN